MIRCPRQDRRITISISMSAALNATHHESSEKMRVRQSKTVSPERMPPKWMMDCWRQSLRVILSCTVILYSGLHDCAGGEASEANQREAQLKELQTRIKKVSKTLENDRGKVDRVDDELRDVESRIGETISRLRRIDANSQRQQELLADLHEKELRQNAELELHRKLLSKQMLATYAMGRQERIKVMLNQEDPALLGRMLQYHAYLGKERVKRIGQIREVLQRVQETKEVIAMEEGRSKELKEQALAQKTELEKDEVERKGVLSELRKQISDRDKELSQLQLDAKELTKLIASLQDALADIPAQSEQNKPFDALKGKMPWPTTGELAASFGSSREAGMDWDGVFIAAAEGHEIRAIHNGRVVYAEWLKGFGLLLIIDHGNGYMSLYGHNQGLLKEVGDWVVAGDVVALAGNSGGLSKSGVYFGVRLKGKPLDPASWCKPLKGNRLGSISLGTWRQRDRLVPLMQAWV